MSAIAVPRIKAPRIVMAGPLPPAIGGMVSVVKDLCESTLRDDFLIETFDTAKKTASGRSLAAAVTARLRMWCSWWNLLGRSRAIAHIHTCSGLSYFLDLALVVIARLRRTHVVLHIHGGRFDEFLDGLDPLRRGIARAGARWADRVVVLSEGWRERLQARLPGARLRVVENGVPIAGPAGSSTDVVPPLVLFLGGLCRAKGVEDLLRAFAQAPGSARLALVGPEGEPGFLSAMRSLIVELGVAERVVFPGPAQGSAKDAWLSRASLFVLPSYAEGLPISLLEAMAAGLPVIATRVGAIPTVIDAGRTGLLIEAGDIDALAGAIARLVEDPALRANLGQRARAECALRFSIDRAARAFRDLYLEIDQPVRLGAAA